MSDQANTSRTSPPSPTEFIETIVVVGGGIAGISCVEALFQEYDQFNPKFGLIVLISEDRLIKRVSNYQSTGRQLEKFDVIEDEIDNLESSAPQGLRFFFVVGTVIQIVTDTINGKRRKLVYKNNSVLGTGISRSLEFDILCVCHGSRPKHLIDCLPRYKPQIFRDQVEQRIIVIRDTSTVRGLKEKLSSCKRIVIVGNGGISLELVTKIANCEKVWIIRDKSMGLTFFDPGAAKFLLDASGLNDDNGLLPINESSRINFTTKFSRSPPEASGEGEKSSSYGPSLGPNWSQNFEFSGGCLSSHKLDVIREDEMADILFAGPNEQYPLKVITTKKKEIDCDLVVLAIGVTPNKLGVVGDAKLEISDFDGGIIIDDQMRTSISQIYAAGDCVSCERWPRNELWFQMRLWTQARQMGHYAGRCITAHTLKQDPSIYNNFNCFTHCTSFFGYRLVLLGNFNGQLFDRDKFEVIARVNSGRDYVKILVGDNGRIFGAVLVGDSGLEETIENLIYDKIDVSAFKEQLLDGTVDIEDYFD